MKYFLTLTLLLLTLLPASAVKKFEPNPINVAAIIVEKTDSAKVASTCEYYGFAYQGVEDGYTVMKRANGNEIKFTFQENGEPQKYPTVIVKTKGTHKEIEEHLKAVNFEKERDIYIAPHNQFSRYITQCNLCSHNTLMFRRLFNNSHK
ncbi:MAG: hypothetical protein HDR47_06895 [Bacteroides sp.]|nr:hypothetical protein [Bacteroides sp.]